MTKCAARTKFRELIQMYQTNLEESDRQDVATVGRVCKDPPISLPWNAISPISNFFLHLSTIFSSYVTFFGLLPFLLILPSYLMYLFVL